MLVLNFVRWMIILVMRMLGGTSNSEISITFPGTKWCGPGNASSSFNDLGVFAASDKCCREHDFCPDFLPAGSSGHGLVNDYPFPRSGCECDEKFRLCLKQVRTSRLDKLTANTLGFIYFTLLEDRCYEKVLQRSPDSSTYFQQMRVLMSINQLEFVNGNQEWAASVLTQLAMKSMNIDGEFFHHSSRKILLSEYRSDRSDFVVLMEVKTEGTFQMKPADAQST